MKVTLLSLFLAFISLSMASAQQAPASPHVKAEGKNITISYGQPSKRDRVIFGGESSKSLEKYGKVWRIGADSATTITFKKNGTFAGKPVKAGTYNLFAIPTEKDWTIILNSELKQWGAYSYEKIKEKDVLKVTVPAKTFPKSEEKLMFWVKDNSVDFQWDKSGFTVPVKF